MTSPRLLAASKSQRTEADARAARRSETQRLRPGEAISYSGFPGTVSRLYADGPTEAARMYEVRLPGGAACVCGSDLIPTKEPTQ